MATSTIEKRRLNMHPSLLLQIIGRQAGTLDKAIEEGAMNAMEAIHALIEDGGKCKDTSVYITYAKEKDKSIVTIKDFGKGITTKKEVVDFFEKFGTPHDESEHKLIAQFRIGRGQMFNFGRNVWRTGTFKLTVDIAKDGLDWEWEYGLPFFDGCHITIELYDKYKNTFPAHTVDCLKDATKKLLEFASRPIFFNGEQINTPPESLKWDFEDDFAYYLFNVGDKLKVYNLGFFVQEKWGMSGVVVSKQQLKVNFPRNDVMADCPVWHVMNKKVRESLIQKSTKKYKTLTLQERRAILNDVRNGDTTFSDAKGSRILETAQGKFLSFSMFLKEGLPWTIAKIGERRADRLIEKGSHTVFSEEMLIAMNYTGEKKRFFSWLIMTLFNNNTGGDGYYVDYTLNHCQKDIFGKESFYEEFSTIFEGNDSYLTVPRNKMTKIERRILDTLGYYGCWDDRVLRIGLSDSADAWTDGRTYINIDRGFLKEKNLTTDSDIANLFAVMIHELAHDNDTTKTDIHGEDFYEKFHEICLRGYDSPFSSMLKFKINMRDAINKDRNDRDKKKRDDALDEQARKLGTKSTVAAKAK